MSDMVLVVNAVIGVCAMLATGIAAWRYTTQQSISAALPAVTTLFVLLALMGVVKTVGTWQSSAGETGSFLVEKKLFGGQYWKYETANDVQTGKPSANRVEPSYGSRVVDQVSARGGTISAGVWNGITASRLPELFTAIFLIHAAWSYLTSPNVLQLVFRLAVLAFLWGSVLGSVHAWFPRTMMGLAQDVAVNVTEGVVSAVGLKAEAPIGHQRNWDKVDVMAAMNSARIPDGVQPLALVWVSALRSTGVISALTSGVISDTALSQVSMGYYVPTPVAGVPDVEIPDVTDGRLGKPRVSTVRVPEPIRVYLQQLAGFTSDTMPSRLYGGSFNIPGVKAYIADHFYDARGQFLFPVDASRLSSEFLSSEYLRSRVTHAGTIEAIRLGPGASWFPSAFQRTFDEIQANEKAAYAAEIERNIAADIASNVRGTDDASESEKQKIRDDWNKKRDLLFRAIVPGPRTTTVAAPLGGVVQGAFEDAIDVGVRADGTAASQYGWRSGATCDEILRVRSVSDPNCWGCMLKHGRELGNLMTMIKSTVGDTSGDYPTVRSAFFASSGVMRGASAMPSGDAPDVDTGGGFFSVLWSFLKFIHEYGAFAMLKVVNAFIIPIAMSWAPMVVGVSLMFLAALWPVIAIASLWPGRATVILDFAKVCFWVMAWVPIMHVGLALIETENLSSGIMSAYNSASAGASIGTILGNAAADYEMAYLLNTIGAMIIFGAPLIAKAVMDPTVGGLSGVVNAGMRKTVDVGGQVAGGAITAGLTLATGGLGAVASGAGAASTAATSAANAGKMASSMRSLAGGASKLQGAASKLQGALKSVAPKSPSTGLGGRLMEGSSAAAGSVESAMQSSIASAANAVMPDSKVPLGDRLAAAAAARVDGNDRGAKAQYQGHGGEQSNRDFGGGGGRGGGSGGGQNKPVSLQQSTQQAQTAHAAGDVAGAGTALGKAQQGASSSTDAAELHATAATARDVGTAAVAEAEAAEAKGDLSGAATQRGVAAAAFATAATAEGRRAQVSGKAGSHAALTQAKTDATRAHQQGEAAAQLADVAQEQKTGTAAGGAGGAASIAVSISLAMSQAGSAAATAPSLRHGVGIGHEAFNRRIVERAYAIPDGTGPTDAANLAARRTEALQQVTMGVTVAGAITAADALPGTASTAPVSASQAYAAARDATQEKMFANAVRHNELALMHTTNGMSEELPPIERVTARHHLEQIAAIPTGPQTANERYAAIQVAAPAAHPGLEASVTQVREQQRFLDDVHDAHRVIYGSRDPLEVGYGPAEKPGCLIGHGLSASLVAAGQDGDRESSMRVTSLHASAVANRLDDASSASPAAAAAQAFANAVAARASREVGDEHMHHARAAGGAIRTLAPRAESEGLDPRVAVTCSLAMGLLGQDSIEHVHARQSVLTNDTVTAGLEHLQKDHTVPDFEHARQVIRMYDNAYKTASGTEQTAWRPGLERGFDRRAQEVGVEISASTTSAEIIGRAGVLYTGLANTVPSSPEHDTRRQESIERARQLQGHMESTYAALPPAEQEREREAVETYRKFMHENLPGGAV